MAVAGLRGSCWVVEMAEFVFPETARRMSVQIEIEEEVVETAMVVEENVVETAMVVEEKVVEKNNESFQSDDALLNAMSQELSFAQVC